MTVGPALPAWWLEQALAAEEPRPAPPLAGDLDVDVAIVGGGYTGLWTALALRERAPELRVALLEAEICGAGPSGRNGGFIHGYWASLASLRGLLGDAGALQLAEAAEQIVPGVRAFAESRGEDVWLREGGMLMVSAAPAQDGAIVRAVEAAAAVGRPDQAVALSRDELARRVASPVFREGVFYPDGATVHPGLLVRALRRAALDAGVELYEGTPVRAGPRRRRRVRRRRRARPRDRARDERRADGVVAGVAQPDELRLVRRPHGARARAGGGDRLDRGRGDRRRADVPPLLPHDERRARAHGQRLRPDRIPRPRRRPLQPRPADRRARRGGAAAAAPGLAGARVERAWGGPIDVSADHLPFFATKPGTRIHYGAGYSGHGVGPSWLGGRILASLALGADDEWTRLPLATRSVPRLPPEPLRRLGGGLVRTSIMACEAAEEEGRRPPLAARAGAALPRLLGMELGTR